MFGRKKIKQDVMIIKNLLQTLGERDKKKSEQIDSMESVIKELQRENITLLERVVKAELIAEKAESQLKELNIMVKIDKERSKNNLTKKWLNGEYDEKERKDL